MAIPTTKKFPTVTITIDDVELILEKANKQQECGDKVRLAKHLDTIVNMYIGSSIWENQIPAYELEKTFLRIHSNSKKILESIYMDNGDMSLETRSHLLRGIDDIGEDTSRLDEIINNIKILQDATESVIPVISNKKESTKSTRKPANQFHTLFSDINRLWLDYYKENPGTSVDPNSGHVTGPYVRFVSELFTIILNKLPEDTKESFPRIYKELTSSNEAIRERFKNTK